MPRSVSTNSALRLRYAKNLFETRLFIGLAAPRRSLMYSVHAPARLKNREPNVLCRCVKAFETSRHAARAAQAKTSKAPAQGRPRRCQDRTDSTKSAALHSWAAPAKRDKISTPGSSGFCEATNSFATRFPPRCSHWADGLRGQEEPRPRVGRCGPVSAMHPPRGCPFSLFAGRLFFSYGGRYSPGQFRTDYLVQCSIAVEWPFRASKIKGF